MGMLEVALPPDNIPTMLEVAVPPPGWGVGMLEVWMGCGNVGGGSATSNIPTPHPVRWH